MKIKIVTFNCLFEINSKNNTPRLERTLQEILNLNPEIICLQEIFTHKQLCVCKEILTKHKYFLSYQKNFWGNTGGLFFASKFEIKNKNFIKFKNQGEILSLQLLDRLVQKGYQRIEINIKGKPIIFFHTHLTSRYSKSSKEDKTLKEQLEQLYVENKKENCVLKTYIGDLNTDKKDAKFINFLRQTNLTNPNNHLKTLSEKNSHKKRFLNPDLNSQIDHILVSKTINILDTKIVLNRQHLINKKKQNLSDHFGLLSNIYLEI